MKHTFDFRIGKNNERIFIRQMEEEGIRWVVARKTWKRLAANEIRIFTAKWRGNFCTGRGGGVVSLP